jgi:hypothetical protein
MVPEKFSIIVLHHGFEPGLKLECASETLESRKKQSSDKLNLLRHDAASVTPFRRSTSLTASVPLSFLGGVAPACRRASTVSGKLPVRKYQPFSDP